jgi:prefoldin subunit 5
VIKRDVNRIKSQIDKLEESLDMLKTMMREIEIVKKMKDSIREDQMDE